MRWIIAPLLLFLINCSGLPTKMQNEPYTDLNLNTIKNNISAYQNTPLRWGGKIIEVINLESSSQAQVLFYPLNHYGRPNINSTTEGRFAITSPQFLDPAIYKQDNEITVTGVLTGSKKFKIGEKTLTLPMISVNHIHLWPKVKEFDYIHAPFYPYPLYDYPGYPFYWDHYYY